MKDRGLSLAQFAVYTNQAREVPLRVIYDREKDDGINISVETADEPAVREINWPLQRPWDRESSDCGSPRRPHQSLITPAFAFKFDESGISLGAVIIPSFGWRHFKDNLQLKIL